MLDYAKLPSCTLVQGELVSGLTMLTSGTASLLQQHPSRLAALLQQYVHQEGATGERTEGAPTAEEAA